MRSAQRERAGCEACHCETSKLGRMPFPSRFKHCPSCGTAVEHRIPADDNRERAVCPACAAIHYQNPLNVVGTLPVWEADGRVLLCRRAIEPRHGLWTLPAGFMELGETTAEGALRETLEEAGADVEMGRLYTVLNVVRVGQVHCSTGRGCARRFSTRAPSRWRPGCLPKPTSRGMRSRSRPHARRCAASSKTVAAVRALACTTSTSLDRRARRAHHRRQLRP